ncbi:conserved protein of unknown function [Pseudomonas marincola]|uniref:Uncharacterized protein n=1 Tax=Pseudomonas marincola TaxID=437900 RepID=A0A653E4F5_9PSED|nr:conserved protein of unknown function [Pseudomonas marincola]
MAGGKGRRDGLALNFRHKLRDSQCLSDALVIGISPPVIACVVCAAFQPFRIYRGYLVPGIG